MIFNMSQNDPQTQNRGEKHLLKSHSGLSEVRRSLCRDVQLIITNTARCVRVKAARTLIHLHPEKHCV